MDVREKLSSKKRLIDANALIKEANADGAYGYVDAKQIADAPTVDAVEVVRCRECNHWKPSGSKAGNSFSDMEYKVNECNHKDCPYRTEPITNADRIRAMSDEELAELLADETYRIAKPCFDAFDLGLEKQAIYVKRLYWLKQSAE